MKYETAKKLKDRGFFIPQEDWTNAVNFSGDKSTYYPTLSELIEACGEKPIRIQSYWSGNDLLWQADTSGNFLVDGNQVAGTGKTPEEAVANLWLALNSNKRIQENKRIR